MTDQWLVALLAVVAFAIFGTGYYIGLFEDRRRRDSDALEAWKKTTRDDLESRSRRVQ